MCNGHLLADQVAVKDSLGDIERGGLADSSAFLEERDHLVIELEDTVLKLGGMPGDDQGDPGEVSIVRELQLAGCELELGDLNLAAAELAGITELRSDRKALGERDLETALAFGFAEEVVLSRQFKLRVREETCPVEARARFCDLKGSNFEIQILFEGQCDG